ncbi:MAG: hypothetical protein QXZ41_06030 [Ignisphaera sp.]
MGFQVAAKDTVHATLNLLRVFLLLSIIAITTYGIMQRDIMAIEGGFKVAVVLLALNAATQNIRSAIATALSIYLMLILFYSSHLYHSSMEYNVIYSAICLLIFTLYSFKKYTSNVEEAFMYFELGALYYVIASSAWVTWEEGNGWVALLIIMLLTIRVTIIPRIRMLTKFSFMGSLINLVLLPYSRINRRIGYKCAKIRNFIAVRIASWGKADNRFTSAVKDVSKSLNGLATIFKKISLSFGYNGKGFCRVTPSISEVGKHIDYYVTYKSIALMKLLSMKFKEMENAVLDKLHRFSSVIEKFQYFMEHTFILLLFLVSTFVLIAILVYILVIS